MTDYANINTPTLAPAAAPLTNTPSAGPDRFPAAYGARYLVVFDNTGGAPITATIDDPTSVTPLNAKTFNPDVDVIITNAQKRTSLIDANRFRDANGWVNIAWSGAMTGTVTIYGPL